jgi:hypothetical protein
MCNSCILLLGDISIDLAFAIYFGMEFLVVALNIE